MFCISVVPGNFCSKPSPTAGLWFHCCTLVCLGPWQSCPALHLELHRAMLLFLWHLMATGFIQPPVTKPPCAGVLWGTAKNQLLPCCVTAVPACQEPPGNLFQRGAASMVTKAGTAGTAALQLDPCPRGAIMSLSSYFSGILQCLKKQTDHPSCGRCLFVHCAALLIPVCIWNSWTHFFNVVTSGV